MKTEPHRGTAGYWLALRVASLDGYPPGCGEALAAWQLSRDWDFWGPDYGMRPARNGCLRMIVSSVAADKPYYGIELYVERMESRLAGDLMLFREEALREGSSADGPSQGGGYNTPATS